MIEPEKILANVADVRPIVAVAPPACVLPRGADAGVVPKTADCVTFYSRRRHDVLFTPHDVGATLGGGQQEKVWTVCQLVPGVRRTAARACYLYDCSTSTLE